MIFDVIHKPDDMPAVGADDLVVVIDVLRASATMCALLAYGAARIHLASDPQDAYHLHDVYRIDQPFLVGERGGVAPPGFHFGNSPLELDDSVRGKEIIYTTTNGTRMAERTSDAGVQLIGSFVNLTSCIDAVWSMLVSRAHLRRVLLCCSGNAGSFSLEDSFFAGAFLSHYIARGSGHDLTNAAEAALCIVSSFQQSHISVPTFSAHGRFLRSLSLGDDVTLCCSIDAFPVVPLCENLIVRQF